MNISTLIWLVILLYVIPAIVSFIYFIKYELKEFGYMSIMDLIKSFLAALMPIYNIMFGVGVIEDYYREFLNKPIIVRKNKI